MKSIVLDIDGVLADFVEGFRKLFGYMPKGAEWEVTREQWDRIGTGDFWRDLKPLPGAADLADLSPLPDEFFLLTSRSERLVNVTMVWLGDNNIQVRRSHVLFADRPGKIDELRRLAPAAFLDDSILNAGMADKADLVEAYLLVQPYTKPVLPYFPSLPRVKSVKEFLKKVMK